jgi:phytoene dehydrogenase-like protein
MVDAIVVGAGPNGLAAAITLAREGCSVLVLEASHTVGGGTRSAELTLPGFVHDVCSAIHPLALSSPFFRSLPLADFGLEWIHPPVPLAHPLDDGTAVLLERSLEATAGHLGRDGAMYRRLMSPFVNEWRRLSSMILGPLLHMPHHPLLMARFGLASLLPATVLARLLFREDRAAALFAGLAAHSMMPLDAPLTSSFGLVVGSPGHAVGWPLARGGSQRIAEALAGYLRSLQGEIITGRPVTSLDDLPPARAVLFDVTPRQLLRIAGDKLHGRYRRELERFQYGPGVFKLDWALDGPIPWRAPECAQSATVHLGGTLREIAASERGVWQGSHSQTPYIILAQQSLFDSSRAPAGKHTAWAYCHVPNGSTQDMTAAIEGQIERFAPGFRDRILARHTFSPGAYEAYNANYIGGDINGGAQTLWQTFFRPAARRIPYSTPLKGVFLCSSSTPPGGGVHGMCGYHAARIALRQMF